VNTHKTTCYECGGDVNPIATACPSCGAPLPFGSQLPTTFHVARKRKRLGPYTEAAARTSLAQGTIRPDDLCWQPGMATWLPVSRVLQPRRTSRPQPIDYGLTYDDLNLYDKDSRQYRLNNGETIWCYGTRPDDTYKEGRRWFGRLPEWNIDASTPIGCAVWILIYTGAMVFSDKTRLVGLIGLGIALAFVLFGIVPGLVIKGIRKRIQGRASPDLRNYWQALHAYDKDRDAAEEAARAAEAAARAAARDAEMRKRSYWTFLDGYAFERATAEVLRKHQFTAMVTRGSGDGGVDIEVTRNGLKGVVQCKAHINCVGPSVVRDLYGVIHHCGASFGIIVSRGGFTRGAADFARDKPILFLDTDDLIAMQEGRDVLATAFTPKET
jgi:Restriction endonuclease/GYF domain 2